MKVTNYNDVNINPNPHGIDARKIYDQADAQVMHLILKPGEGLKTHKIPVDVFFYVLEGTGIVEIGDEREEVKKDNIIESPANIPHTLKNESDSIVRFLVVKTPNPNK
jgi:mannose-6-phosphate isomerase-like protein (cupin superfamily)